MNTLAHTRAQTFAGSSLLLEISTIRLQGVAPHSSARPLVQRVPRPSTCDAVVAANRPPAQFLADEIRFRVLVVFRLWSPCALRGEFSRCFLLVLVSLYFASCSMRPSSYPFLMCKAHHCMRALFAALFFDICSATSLLPSSTAWSQ